MCVAGERRLATVGTMAFTSQLNVLTLNFNFKLTGTIYTDVIKIKYEKGVLGVQIFNENDPASDKYFVRFNN